MKAFEILLKKILMVDPFTKEKVFDRESKVLEGTDKAVMVNTDVQSIFSYRRQLWIILQAKVNDKGMSTNDMMKRARVQFILEGAEDDKPIFLEEAHYILLKKCIEENKWLVSSTYISQMINDVKTAKQVELNPEEKKEEK